MGWWEKSDRTMDREENISKRLVSSLDTQEKTQFPVEVGPG